MNKVFAQCLTLPDAAQLPDATTDGMLEALFRNDVRKVLASS